MPPLARPLALLTALCLATPSLAQMAPQGPKEVGVMTLEEAQVPYTVTLPGRAVAFQQTEIRPRVGGVIEEIAYTAGRPVAVGDLLFRLEDDSYRATLAAAEATRTGAEAAVQTAQATVDRYSQLVGTGVTTGDYQTAQSTLAQAKATLLGAEADLQTAQLDLDRTEIRSPIAGFVDVAEVSVGSIVTANQTTALTTVTTLDPIYIDVEESSARMMRVRARIDDGTMQPGDQLSAILTLETGQTYAGVGRLVSPSATVSTTTGSIDFRFQFDNPNRMILPGQFLRVQIEVGQQTAVLVPQRATERQSDGTLTAFVVRDGTAQQVQLTSDGTYQNAWITTQGVQAGDLVIVDGLENLGNGAEVTTVPVKINDEGVVEDVTDTDDTAQPATTEAD